MGEQSGATQFMRRLANAQREGSFSNRMRNRRFERFRGLMSEVQPANGEPLRVLDVGGTTAFWEHRGLGGAPGVNITLVNLHEEESSHPNIVGLTADATDLGRFDDHSFDLVFSNSVIEHLFSLEAQRKMAVEVQRVGRGYWVQTPNFWFPVEPHFLTPGWHWLPRSLRVAALRRRRFGWRGPCPDSDDARRLVEEIRLMRPGEVQRLFPEARLIRERFFGLTKSLIAVRVPDRKP